jgi:two-component system sensor histidine kinase/response regulator
VAKRFSFRDLPIGRKLLAVGAAVTGVMLLGLSAFMMVRAVTDWRSQTVHELTSNAKIIAANAAPALLFNDRAAAAETLSALSEAPDIVYAAVYDIHGVRFAVHGVEKAGPGRLAPDFATTGHSFSRNAVTVSEPIVFKGERLGSIYLKADLRELIAALVRDGAISLAALAIAFGLSIVLFYRLQRGIVRPITQLSGMMSKVSEGGSYSTRAPDFGRDEVGVLARTFNDMLGVIEDRDTRLAQHQAQLEDTVRQRTGELNQANARLQEELAQRAAAQEALRAHDAMLKAVAHGAGELLGTLNLDEAITAVLELIGQTLADQSRSARADQQRPRGPPSLVGEL